jgi:hypothetical protein
MRPSIILVDFFIYIRAYHHAYTSLICIFILKRTGSSGHCFISAYITCTICEYRAKPFCLSGVVRNVLCFDMQRCQADLIYIITYYTHNMFFVITLMNSYQNITPRHFLSISRLKSIFTTH